MMVAEIAGARSSLDALLADGCTCRPMPAAGNCRFRLPLRTRHAATHASLSARQAGDLAGFASAIVLLGRPDDRLRIGARLFQPGPSTMRGDRHRRGGLLVNLLSAWMLGAAMIMITTMTRTAIITITTTICAPPSGT